MDNSFFSLINKHGRPFQPPTWPHQPPSWGLYDRCFFMDLIFFFFFLCSFIFFFFLLAWVSALLFFPLPHFSSKRFWISSLPIPLLFFFCQLFWMWDWTGRRVPQRWSCSPWPISGPPSEFDRFYTFFPPYLPLISPPSWRTTFPSLR